MKILTILIILNSILFGFLLIEKFSTFSKVSAVETYGDLGAYWDNECTQRVTSIEWGVLQPGSNKNINLFIKNEGENTICPTLSTENWSPSIAFEYLNIEWNCTGESIKSGEKLQIMLTLTIPFIVDFTDFSFDILINAKESNLEILIQESNSWFCTSNTQINSVAVDDVDGDDDVEIVTGGYYYDGERDIAQLIVWDEATQAVENTATFYWTGDTPINSVGVGNLDDDEALEIVTGGYYFDGFRKVAQLVVWDGTTLAVDGLTTWYWTGNTEITSLKVEDIDGDGSAEIITGGYYNDGVRDIAQLVVWNGSTLSALRITGWYWIGNTRINDIDVKNLDDDLTKEIITAGYFTDECKIAHLIVWDGETLDVEKLTSWFWTNDTVISSVSCADIDSDAEVEIVTGGYYNDNNRDIAQLVIWNSESMSVERLTSWYWTNDTHINSISIGDVDRDNSAEIITGGYFNDFSRDIAQLVVWDATASKADYLTSWYWTSDTSINSVNTTNIDADLYSEIITGGKFYDNNRNCAQITIWEIS